MGKEQLALAVRKNFNDAAVNEIDVMVDLLYKVRNQGMLMSWGFGGGLIADLGWLQIRRLG